MLPFKLNSFGNKEWNWTHEEYQHVERIIMTSELADITVKSEILSGKEEQSVFHKIASATGVIYGGSAFMMPVIWNQNIWLRVPLALLNGYCAYYFIEKEGNKAMESRIYRAWI